MTNIINMKSYEILYNEEEDAFLFSFDIADTNISLVSFPKTPVSFTFNKEEHNFDILFKEKDQDDVLLEFPPLPESLIEQSSFSDFEKLINNNEKKIFILGLHESVPVEQHHIYFVDTVNVVSQNIKKVYKI